MNDSTLTLDTSVVLRLLVRDPLPAFRVASALMEEHVRQGRRLAVPDLVLAEAYHALQHHYGFSKADALAALHGFSAHPGIKVGPGAQKVLTLPNLASAKPGFVDRLIHGACQAAGHTLITFEKSARKLPGTLVLEASLPLDSREPSTAGKLASSAESVGERRLREFPKPMI